MVCHFASFCQSKAVLLPAFAHQKSGQMKMADSVPPPPHSLHEIAATAYNYKFVIFSNLVRAAWKAKPRAPRRRHCCFRMSTFPTTKWAGMRR